MFMLLTAPWVPRRWERYVLHDIFTTAQPT